MAINPLYIPLFNIEEVILDKDTGLPLAAGVVSFFRDSQRLTPKVVYQISGVSPNYTFISVGSVLTLGISGTFVDQNGDPFVPYAFPYDSEGNLDLYYVTVVSSGGVPQFVRQAVPYVNSSNIPPDERTNTENELSNPQFVDVNFIENQIAVVSVTGSNTVTSVAPGWDIITSGSGTLTLERLQPTSADVVTNPPYALRILASAGLGSTFQLRQRLDNSPSIFRNGFVSASLTAAVISGGGSFVSMNYIPSTGTPTEIIPSTSIPTDGAYHIIANNAAIPDQGNTAADTGYVDISITLPTARNLAITSIQIVGTADSINIPFDEQTAARQRDHLAHYYKPQLAAMPIPSYLVGWDFPLNPAQFGNTISAPAIGANKSFYAWDQTIVFQSANSGIGVNRGNAGELILTAAATSSAAIIQYSDSFDIYDLLKNNISVYLSAYAAATNLKVTISLWYTKDASLPSTVTSHNSLVATLDANGKPATFNGNWIEIPRALGQDATCIVPNIKSDSSFNEFVFNGWHIATPSDLINFTFFAIVIGTESFTATNALVIQSVGLCSGDIATKPAPQATDEVLRECQYFYEKSYSPQVMPGTTTAVGQEFGLQATLFSAGTLSLYPASFSTKYNTVKRVVPTLTIYAPTVGNVGHVDAYLIANGSLASSANAVLATFWTQHVNGLRGFQYDGTSGSAITNFSTTLTSNYGYATWHYVADSRLGI